MANTAPLRGGYPHSLRDTLPVDLLELPRWVVWRLEKRTKKDPKPTKVLYSPRTGRRASSTDAATWAPFAAACERYADGSYAGIGFVLGDGVAGVDLDTCRNAATGELEPWAHEIVRQLASYTEASPSGTGVHILVRGAFPAGQTRRRRGQVEMYDGGRFFTVTGARLPDTPATLEERTAQLAALHAQVFAPSAAPATPRAAQRPAESPAAPDLLLRALGAANGEKFRRLWSGDVGGYTSASEADMALCAMLAFWAGPDAERIDMLYRQSGMYPTRAGKWDRRTGASTYGARTIAAVLAAPRDYYDPARGRAQRSARRAAAPHAPSAQASPALAPDVSRGDLAPASSEGGSRGSRRRSYAPDDDGTADGEEWPGALRLTQTARGWVYYCEDATAEDGEGSGASWPGLYLANTRGVRCLLSARVEVISVDANDGTRGGSRYRVALTSPLAPERPIRATLSRESVVSGAAFVDEHGLAGLVQTVPTSKPDCEAVWQGIIALAALATLHNPAIRTQRTHALGWHDGAWVRCNGHIDRAGAHLGGHLIAAVPDEWPQAIPADAGALPSRLDASLVRRLLAFWPAEVTRFPYALLGACAHIMRPDHDGIARWELELFGNTEWYKTTLVNWTLRAFFGAGYSHRTATQLREGKAGDTGIGRSNMRHALAYHAYLTYDFDQKPGMPRYDAQQNERIESLMSSGNSDQGGAKSNREGGLESRPSPRGLLVRTGEASPYDYTVPIGKHSADARAVTFCIDGASGGRRDALLAQSKELQRRAGELDALAILHTRWLAAQSPADSQAQWGRIQAAAASLVARVYYDAGGYPDAHSRTREQCEDIAAGVLSYCLFLRAVDIDSGTFDRAVTGAAELAGELNAELSAFVGERLAASDALGRRYRETRGGDTQEEVTAHALCVAIRDALMSDWRLTSQDTPLPTEENPAPQERPPARLPVSWELTGWERVTLGYGTPTTEWRPRPRTLPLGCEYDGGRYIALDRTALDRLARQAAKSDKRITYTTLTRLLAALLAAGAIVGSNEQEHPYTRPVRRPDTKRPPRMVCFPADRIWPEAAAANDDSTAADDATSTTHINNPIEPGTPGTTGTPGTPQQYDASESASQAVLMQGALSAAESEKRAEGSKLVPGGDSEPGTAQQYAPDTWELPDGRDVDAGDGVGERGGADVVAADSADRPRERGQI